MQQAGLRDQLQRHADELEQRVVDRAQELFAGRRTSLRAPWKSYRC
jgi:hypothetical protein